MTSFSFVTPKEYPQKAVLSFGEGCFFMPRFKRTTVLEDNYVH